ncbi:MAG: hypothetical protein KDB61_05265, partial [Planctomycetes bacterium]|nr:hypothetical protein [Planctomycetota bacterium]
MKVTPVNAREWFLKALAPHLDAKGMAFLSQGGGAPDSAVGELAARLSRASRFAKNRQLDPDGELLAL